MSTQPESPFCPNVHRKELLTQCDSETKIQRVVGEKMTEETQCVPSLGGRFFFSPLVT